MFDHYDPAPQNSVYKLLSDMFSNKATAGLLYTNDAKVLIDILLRNITDLPPGTSVSVHFSNMCRTNYRSTTQIWFESFLLSKCHRWIEQVRKQFYRSGVERCRAVISTTVIMLVIILAENKLGISLTHREESWPQQP